MDEETRKEASREWGEKYAREGEKIDNPSGVTDEFKEGFRKGSLGFGSNVNPRNFGKGGSKPKDWDCLCGHTNRGNVRYMKAGREVCQLCGMEKEFALQAIALGEKCAVCEGYDIPGASHSYGKMCSRNPRWEAG